MPRLAKSTSVAAFIVSTPPPPPASDSNAVPSLSVTDSGAVSYHDSSSALASGPEHDASRSTASIAPAWKVRLTHFLVCSEIFIVITEWLRARPPVMFSAVSSSAPVLAAPRCIARVRSSSVFDIFSPRSV